MSNEKEQRMRLPSFPSRGFLYTDNRCRMMAIRPTFERMRALLESAAATGFGERGRRLVWLASQVAHFGEKCSFYIFIFSATFQNPYLTSPNRTLPPPPPHPETDTPAPLPTTPYSTSAIIKPFHAPLSH